MAVNGKVQGYFQIADVNPPDLEFHSETWTPIRNGEAAKPLQGWKYYNHEKEVK